MYLLFNKKGCGVNEKSIPPFKHLLTALGIKIIYCAIKNIQVCFCTISW